MEPKNSIPDSSAPYSGPYRATKLWNEVIVAFRNEMPLGRHRRYMKTYDDCFSSSEGIDWLLDYLRSNQNFGPDVTRAQTIQLLQKLHRSRVVEDVRGGKHNRADVCDNNRLFRFVHASPSRNVHSRTPLTNRHDLINKDQPPINLDLDNEKPAQMSPVKVIQECHIVAKQLNIADVEETWKNMTLDRLQEVLGIDDISGILDSSFVSGKHVMHNCLYINKSGIVTNIEPKDQLPHWALSAMKCLAHWPEKVDDNLPSYPGFEKDVFRVVKDYFCGLSEPLMTFEMYEVILNVFMSAEGLIQEDCDDDIDIPDPASPKSINSFESVENLLLNLTNVGCPSGGGSTPDIGLHRVCSASALELSPIYPVGDCPRGKRPTSTSSSNLPVAAKYETAFGPENKTVTKVYFKDGIQSEYGFSNGPEELSKTPIETHFRTSLEIPPLVQASEQSNDLYGVNFAYVKSTSRQQSEPCVRNTVKYNIQSSRRKITDQCNNHRDGIKTNGHYTKNKHFMPSRRSYSDSTHPGENRMTPDYIHPPSYHSLFPDGYRPVIDGASHKSLSRSVSSQALHMIKSLSNEDEDCQHSLNRHTYNTESLGRYGSRVSLDSGIHSQKSDRKIKHPAIRGSNSHEHLQRQGKSLSNCQLMNRMESRESLNGRSLSLSDLLHGDAKGMLRRCTSDTGQVKHIIEKIKQSLQLVLLLLPPANRRKLHLLLKLMHKMANNIELQIDSDQNTRTLLLETFYRSVLSCQDEGEMEDLLVMRIVSFLIDYGVEIMLVPKDLKIAVEDKLSNMSKTQIVYSRDDYRSFHYCKQVSNEDFESQRMSSSQKALEDLLEEIINDKSMSAVRRKQRLKKFEKCHPDIYAKKFAGIELKKEDIKPKIKQPLLIKPFMNKLRGLRI